jgi:hypothetical protein
MKSLFTRTLCGIALSACLVSSAAHAAKPMDSWDGLELREGRSGLDAVYVRPGVKFAAYKSVQLDPVVVEFSKSWERNSLEFEHQLTAAELQQIRGKLAGLMREVFMEELATHGYTVVDVATDDTLRISTALREVYMNPRNDAKADASHLKTFSPGAGSMTLVLEARDAPTGQLLARAIDERADENAAARPDWNTAPEGTAARVAFGIWARSLREALDRLNQGSKQKR